MRNYFEDAKLKIEQGNRHINELDSFLKNYINTNPYRVVIEENPLSGLNTLGLDATKPIPNEVAAFLGDAIHNFRAALDHAVWGAIRCTGREPGRESGLPFSDSEKGMVAELNKRLRKVAGADICDLIARDIRPYKGGNETLYNLHHLDIIDKHRHSLVTFKVVQVDNVCARCSNGIVIKNQSFCVGGDGLLRGISGLGEVKIENYGDVTLQVVFGGGFPLEGEPVLPMLNRISKLVAATVSKFRKLGIAILQDNWPTSFSITCYPLWACLTGPWGAGRV